MLEPISQKAVDIIEDTTTDTTETETDTTEIDTTEIGITEIDTTETDTIETDIEEDRVVGLMIDHQIDREGETEDPEEEGHQVFQDQNHNFIINYIIS